MKAFATLLMALGLLSSANAALFSRAVGTMVYDDVLKITWLADWNYAYSSGYAAANEGGALTISYDSWRSTIVSADGRMGWDAAMAWAANLVFGGYDDWRLPTGDNSQPLGPLNEFRSIHKGPNQQFGIQGPFLNTSGFRWSSDEITLSRLLDFAPYNASYYSRWPTRSDVGVGAFVIETGAGGQGPFDKIDIARAVAVRDGDVAPVPVPATLALLSLGLIGVCAACRSRPDRG